MYVDGEGTLHLKNLMECWGRENNLNDKQMKDALYDNSSYGQGGGARFTPTLAATGGRLRGMHPDPMVSRCSAG